MSGLRDLHLGAGRTVPAAALSVRFARSGGPGGQHVNKTETKVDLRLDLDASGLDEERVARIRNKLENRLDADGRVVVTCEETRSRTRNLDVAIDRLEELLRQALVRPKPRRATRPTRGSKERRLKEKKARGDIKRQRRGDDLA